MNTKRFLFARNVSKFRQVQKKVNDCTLHTPSSNTQVQTCYGWFHTHMNERDPDRYPTNRAGKLPFYEIRVFTVEIVHL